MSDWQRQKSQFDANLLIALVLTHKLSSCVRSLWAKSFGWYYDPRLWRLMSFNPLELQEPNNLKARNSFRFNGLVHKKTVGVQPAADGKGVVVVLKKRRGSTLFACIIIIISLFILLLLLSSLTNLALKHLTRQVFYQKRTVVCWHQELCCWNLSNAAQVRTNLPPLTRRSPSTRTPVPPSTVWGTLSARTSTGRTCAWWAHLHIISPHFELWDWRQLLLQAKPCVSLYVAVFHCPQAALRRASAILKSQKPVVVKKKRTRAAKTA